MTARAVGSLSGGGLFALGVGVPFDVSSVVGIAFIFLAIPSLGSAGRGADLYPALAVAGHG